MLHLRKKSTGKNLRDDVPSDLGMIFRWRETASKRPQKIKEVAQQLRKKKQEIARLCVVSFYSSAFSVPDRSRGVCAPRGRRRSRRRQEGHRCSRHQSIQPVAILSILLRKVFY
jgi:hypothetical protein